MKHYTEESGSAQLQGRSYDVDGRRRTEAIGNTDSEYVCEARNGSLLEGNTIEPLCQGTGVK
ncbi:unnamed protein product, partial [Pleuronectes platessa]